MLDECAAENSGHRAQALCKDKTTKLLSRNGNDLGLQFPAMLPELAAAISNGSIVDGKLVALDHRESRLQHDPELRDKRSQARFLRLDLLQFERTDLTGKPLAERRSLLRSALGQNESVQLSETFQIRAEQLLALVRGHGLDGMAAKRLYSTYEQGKRSGARAKMRVELFLPTKLKIILDVFQLLRYRLIIETLYV